MCKEELGRPAPIATKTIVQKPVEAILKFCCDSSRKKKKKNLKTKNQKTKPLQMLFYRKP